MSDAILVKRVTDTKEPLAGSLVEKCTQCGEKVYVHPNALMAVQEMGIKDVLLVCTVCCPIANSGMMSILAKMAADIAKRHMIPADEIIKCHKSELN